MPFSKPGKFFREALDSTLASEGVDFELILIANTAGAKEYELARNYALQDSRIRLLEESRPGISYALNTGWESASFPWIARMDSDDIMHPRRLRKQLDFLLSHPDLAAAGTQVKLIGHEQKNNQGYRHYVQWINALLSAEENYHHRFLESPFAHPSMMFRQDLKKYGLYDTGNVPEDYELWLRWMDLGLKMAKLPETLLDWRDHPERLSRNDGHYSEAAFFRVKAHYLKRLLLHKNLIACGSSPEAIQRIRWLQQEGFTIRFHTDIHQHQSMQDIPFLPANEIPEAGSFTLVSLIGQYGVREKVENWASGLGYQKGTDFFALCGL